ncbi:hypothetical protein M413DRAFT_419793 [Hebeloma cylindrosporum]|uniref:Protein kinase domain-containing protein n=1 Tax=Hebeloma cylindrosporum TaxID=76867 RepID=A0A0C3C5G9_HEBCY|nr:hypothetical protein M413DRAFT_419793 [Hebeloma cylindrosporum h7]
MTTITPQNLSPGKGGLDECESYWRDKYQWLRDRGYQLRPRYSPDWIPSWVGTTKNHRICEDGVPMQHTSVCDAIHIPTGAQVALKSISKLDQPREAEIMKYLSSDPLCLDPRNHCARLLEVLELPDYMAHGEQILVMPLLRPFNSPTFDTFGEAIDCFRQLFEGLRFLHEHHVAHRDLNMNNFMMEWENMFPHGFHPQAVMRRKDATGTTSYFTRTQRPTRYIIIDFGMSSRYHPNDVSPQEECLIGGDKTVPEFLKGQMYHDPYKADIYYAGNLIRTEFMQARLSLPSHFNFLMSGFEFMKPLIDDMVQDDPDKRPNMNEVVQRFEAIVQGLSQWKIRSRAHRRMLFFSDKMRIPLHILSHWRRKATYIMKRTPAIPSVL